MKKHMTNRLRKITLLCVALIPSMVMAVAWALDSSWKLFEGAAKMTGTIGNLSALVGLPLLALMVLLGVRFTPIERIFGLDRMLRLHKTLGTVVVMLFVSHALLRFTKASLVKEGILQWDVLFSFSGGDIKHWGMNMARLSMAGILLAAGLARLSRPLMSLPAVSFRIWKPLHLALYAAFPLGLAHAMISGDDTAHMPYSIIWAVAAAGFLALAAKRLYGWAAGRHNRCNLHSIRPETHDTATLSFERPDVADAFTNRKPGQFCLIRQQGLWQEPHPFTLSGDVHDRNLSCTVKQCGDFSGLLPKLPPGTPITCEGPYGVFVPDPQNKHLACIAGGIGITPFLSWLRSMQPGPEVQVSLIWANKTLSDIFARDELAAMAARIPLRVLHVLSRQDPPVESGDNRILFRRGHIDAGMLREFIDPQDAAFCLCGPLNMQRHVLGELKKAFGLQARDVHRELFFW